MNYSREHQKRITDKILELSNEIADITVEICEDATQNPYRDPNYPVLVSQELLNIVILELMTEYQKANADYSKVASEKLKERNNRPKPQIMNIGG